MPSDVARSTADWCSSPPCLWLARLLQGRPRVIAPTTTAARRLRAQDHLPTSPVRSAGGLDRTDSECAGCRIAESVVQGTEWRSLRVDDAVRTVGESVVQGAGCRQEESTMHDAGAGAEWQSLCCRAQGAA